MTDEQKNQIKNIIESEKVFLMLKGTPSQPACGFSARVVKVLNKYLSNYAYFNVFDNIGLMNAIKEYANWPTTPQLFVQGELIGGCDIIEQLDREKSLENILNDTQEN
jgi:monothiol glutaredoxin